jgi:integrase
MPSHLSVDQMIALLLQARLAEEADYVMILLTFHHALRESEVVGQKTTQRGQFQIRAQAEMRLAEVTALEPDNPAEIQEKKIRIKRKLRTVWQVHVKEARLVGGLTPENFSRGYIYVDRLKGSHPVRDPLATRGWLAPDIIERPVVEEFLRAHAAAHGGDGRQELLFPMNRKTYWDKMKKYGRAAGIPEHLCHPHILKHSIAKFLLNVFQMKIDTLQTRMGHKDLGSTGAYLKADESETQLEIAKAEALLAARHPDPLPEPEKEVEIEGETPAKEPEEG